MPDIFQSVSLITKIMEARNAMQGLFREHYEDETKDWRTIIKKAMAKYDCNELEAILHVSRIVEDVHKRPMSGISVALLFSAAADLIDETNLKTETPFKI